MIAPAIDSDALATRLDRLPSRLRDALTRELDRLGARLHLWLTIETTSDTVTAFVTPRTIVRLRGSAWKRTLHRRGREGFAEGAMAFKPPQRLRVLRASSASSAVSGFLLSTEAEIRAGLETAAREACAA